MKITLKQLQAFVNVAKFNNVSLAAQELCLSQSAVSTCLAELETQLGTELFSRQGKKLILNSQGKIMLPKSHAALNKILEIYQLFSNQTEDGLLNIGASATISRHLLSDILQKYSIQYPDEKISLKIKDTQQIIDELTQYKIDIGFSEKFTLHPHLEIIPWYQDHLVIFSATNHPLAKKKKITKKDLMDESWILREQEAGIINVFGSNIAPVLKKINVKMIIGHNEVIKNMVANNFGISCLSALSLQDAPQKKKLAILSTPFLNLNRQFYILLRKESRGRGLENFLKLIDR